MQQARSRKTVLSLLAALGLGALLSGCALPRMIDSDVASYSGTVAATTPANYTFERLPSQTQSARQDAIEAMTGQALRKVGLALSDAGTATPQYRVQASVQISQITNPYRGRPRSSVFWGMGDPGPAGASLVVVMEPPWYRHSVQLVLRESQTNLVAYETTAVFDGPWSDSLNLLPAVMDAALRDFPRASGAVHKVVIELPVPTTQP